MPQGQLRTLQDCEDFIRGCTLFGTGGGGAPSKGMKLLSDELAAGRTPAWIDLDDLPDDAWIACAWGMGSIAPSTPEREDKMKAYGLGAWSVEKNLARALQELQEYTGRRLSAVIPLEPGGSNTPNPLAAATSLGLATVDADLAGRAIPEIAQTLPVLAGIPLGPVASVDLWGNVAILRETHSVPMAERIGKHLAVAAFGHTGLAGFLTQVKKLRSAVVPGTLTRCLAVGRAIRAAREQGRCPVDAIVEATGARRLFTGVVTRKEWQDQEGYMIGRSFLVAADNSGRHMEIWFKNENHVAWLDGKPVALSPDLIMVVGTDTGEPRTNTELAEGERVTVLGLPCHPAFRTPEGLRLLGPRHFGFDIDYVPIEELARQVEGDAHDALG
ncbi:MAG TPA: DUF917 domain-containing protein [Limnochordales bacterium]|nr:DUF917 domain-containing protein [Limnochordales bacterium]